MASRTPIVRQISWLATLPQFVAIGIAIAVGHHFMGRDGVTIGAVVYLAYSLGSRKIICSAHRAGIRYVRHHQFAQAIPEFQQSFEFFERHPWIDRFRSITLMSASAPSYREMALANIGFCYSQIGDGQQSRNYYEKCLARFPDSSLAKMALRMLDAGASGPSRPVLESRTCDV